MGQRAWGRGYRAWSMGQRAKGKGQRAEGMGHGAEEGIGHGAEGIGRRVWGVEGRQSEESKRHVNWLFIALYIPVIPPLAKATVSKAFQHSKYFNIPLDRNRFLVFLSDFRVFISTFLINLIAL